MLPKTRQSSKKPAADKFVKRDYTQKCLNSPFCQENQELTDNSEEGLAGDVKVHLPYVQALKTQEGAPVKYHLPFVYAQPKEVGKGRILTSPDKDFGGVEDVRFYRKKFLESAVGKPEAARLMECRGLFIHLKCIKCRGGSEEWIQRDARGNYYLKIFMESIGVGKWTSKQGVLRPRKASSSTTGGPEVSSPTKKAPRGDRLVDESEQNLQQGFEKLLIHIEPHISAIGKEKVLQLQKNIKSDLKRVLAGLRSLREENEELKKQLEQKVEEYEAQTTDIDQIVQEAVHQAVQEKVASLKSRMRLKDFVDSEEENTLSKPGPFHHLTGIGNHQMFQSLMLLVRAAYRPQEGSNRGRNHVLDEDNQLFMTLFIMRTGVTQRVAAALFGIDDSTVCRYFAYWTYLLYRTLLLIHPMPSRSLIRKYYPPTWKKELGSTRVRYVIDSSNWDIYRPSDAEEQTTTHSYYYGGNCGKYLVVTSPLGVILYVSAVYPGHISDRDLVLHSFIAYGYLEPGDDIMSDRGFNIKDILLLIYCDLVMPPCRRRDDTAEGADFVHMTQEVAHKRIHVERSIGLGKHWKILRRLMYRQQWDLMTMIVTNVYLITNLTMPMMVATCDRLEIEDQLVKEGARPSLIRNTDESSTTKSRTRLGGAAKANKKRRLSGVGVALQAGDVLR